MLLNRPGVGGYCKRAGDRLSRRGADALDLQQLVHGGVAHGVERAKVIDQVLGPRGAADDALQQADLVQTSLLLQKESFCMIHVLLVEERDRETCSALFFCAITAENRLLYGEK